MRYPFLSNWIVCKKIPGRDAYYVRDYVLDSRCLISVEQMRFAKKLDGRTDPYSLYRGKSRSEIRELLEELDLLGVIRCDHGVISRGRDGYKRTLIRTKDTKAKKLLAGLLNFLLLFFCVPVLITGIYVFCNTSFWMCSDLSFIEVLLRKNRIVSIVLFYLIGIAGGGAIHEMSHAAACRAYGGRVFEYGIALGIFPGFYTLLDQSGIRSGMKRIQVYAAGTEGNILYAGFLLILSGVFPGIGNYLSLAAAVNLVMCVINMIAMKGTDGSKILMALIGLDNVEGYEKLDKLTQSRRARRMLKNEGLCGHVQLTACFIIILLQKVFPVLLLLDIVSWIGVFS
ncbi:MAG: hypothetical protein K6E50_01230 [Lachnospiraceae bacterium]|nr:hypothetical protein [Lachnospiraceae bacterium]